MIWLAIWIILSLNAGIVLAIRGQNKRINALEIEAEEYRAIIRNVSTPANDPRRQTSLGL